MPICFQLRNKYSAYSLNHAAIIAYLIQGIFFQSAHGAYEIDNVILIKKAPLDFYKNYELRCLVRYTVIVQLLNSLHISNKATE